MPIGAEFEKIRLDEMEIGTGMREGRFVSIDLLLDLVDLIFGGIENKYYGYRLL